MTLDELQRSLPNGLHDAELVAVRTDYLKREAIIELRIDMSAADGARGQEKEVHRPARLVFSGLQFVVIDPPDARDDYLGISTIDVGPAQPSTAPRDLPPIAAGCFLCWVFVVRWNSFIRIAAQSVTLEWTLEDWA